MANIEEEVSDLQISLLGKLSGLLFCSKNIMTCDSNDNDMSYVGIEISGQAREAASWSCYKIQVLS